MELPPADTEGVGIVVLRLTTPGKTVALTSTFTALTAVVHATVPGAVSEPLEAVTEPMRAAAPTTPGVALDELPAPGVGTVAGA